MRRRTTQHGIKKKKEGPVPWAIKWAIVGDQVAARMITTMEKLEIIYDLTLDYEQAGRALTFLEVWLIWEGDQLSWGLKNKLLHSQMTKVPPVHRYPHIGEPSTPHVVRGMACALGGKSNLIQTSPE